MKNTVLFLCTNNSCRSQMAEGFLKSLAANRFEVFSAGLFPREIHPFALRMMAEVGIDISTQHPKGVKEFFRKTSIAYAIVVCERAERECPRLFPGALEVIYWPFEDPAAFEGLEEERLTKFRAVRDEIDVKIREWLKELQTGGVPNERH